MRYLHWDITRQHHAGVTDILALNFKCTEVRALMNFFGTQEPSFSSTNYCIREILMTCTGLYSALDQCCWCQSTCQRTCLEFSCCLWFSILSVKIYFWMIAHRFLEWQRQFSQSVGPLSSRLKYLNNWRMDCHESLHRHLWSPEEESYWPFLNADFSTTKEMDCHDI